MTTKEVNRFNARRLAMLADWQLREMGYDPQQVTAMVLREQDETDRLWTRIFSGAGNEE